MDRRFRGAVVVGDGDPHERMSFHDGELDPVGSAAAALESLGIEVQGSRGIAVELITAGSGEPAFSLVGRIGARGRIYEGPYLGRIVLVTEFEAEDSSLLLGEFVFVEFAVLRLEVDDYLLRRCYSY